MVEHPHKAPSRQIWLDEQAGKPTRYNIYRADVQEAIDRSITGRGMVQYLRGRGYIVDSTGPNLKIRLPQYPHFTRLDTLNPQWTNQGIERLIYDRDDLVSSRSKPPRKPDIPDWLKEAYQPRKRTTKIYRLYLYYCYQLGILPKGTAYHPVSPQLRADLRHLDDIDRQTRYLASHKIETVEELLADRAAKESRLEALTPQRTKLQNKIRRASPEQKIILRKEKRRLLPKLQPCARTFVTARKMNNGLWKSGTHWIGPLRQSIRSGTVKSRCGTTDKHYSKININQKYKYTGGINYYRTEIM